MKITSLLFLFFALFGSVYAGEASRDAVIEQTIYDVKEPGVEIIQARAGEFILMTLNAEQAEGLTLAIDGDYLEKVSESLMVSSPKLKAYLFRVKSKDSLGAVTRIDFKLNLRGSGAVPVISQEVIPLGK